MCSQEQKLPPKASVLVPGGKELYIYLRTERVRTGLSLFLHRHTPPRPNPDLILP